MITRRQVARFAVSGAVASPFLFPRAFADDAPGRMSMGSPMPLTHPITTALTEAVDAIRRDTGGKVDIEFFPNSQLGSELSMQGQLRSGAIDFTATSVSSLQTALPLAGIPGVAFAFNGYGELWPALDTGELGERIRAGLATLGYTAFRVLDNGFRDVITGAKPVTGVADLAGMKIRVPPSPLLTSLFRLLGAAPTTINLAETYAALQTKLADGMENSLPNIEATKVYEVQKYISRTGHSWDGLWILANSRRWEAIAPDLQAIVTRHFDAAAERQRRDFVAMNQTSEAHLKAAGIAFNAPDREAFRKALISAGYYAEWKSKFGVEAWTSLEKTTGPLGS